MAEATREFRRRGGDDLAGQGDDATVHLGTVVQEVGDLLGPERQDLDAKLLRARETAGSFAAATKARFSAVTSLGGVPAGTAASQKFVGSQSGKPAVWIDGTPGRSDESGAPK